MKNLSKLLAIAALVVVVFSFWGCNQTRDNLIKGKVIGYEYCTSEIYGYLIDVQSPAGIGGTVFIYGTEHGNVVKTYSKPENDFQIGDEISGVYQMMADSSICRICQDLYLVYDLPEVIIKYKN